jgi:hypothetical protein
VSLYPALMKNQKIALSSGGSRKGKYGDAEINGSGINDFDLRGLLRMGGQFGGNPPAAGQPLPAAAATFTIQKIFLPDANDFSEEPIT